MFDYEIQTHLRDVSVPELQSVDIHLQKHLKSRGRYSNRKFWHLIQILQKDKMSKIDVCPQKEYKDGFLNLYNFIKGD